MNESDLQDDPRWKQLQGPSRRKKTPDLQFHPHQLINPINWYTAFLSTKEQRPTNVPPLLLCEGDTAQTPRN